MLTTPNSYDTLLDSNRGADFLLSNNRHRVGLRDFRFSIANRNVPFYLEEKMPKGIFVRTEELKNKIRDKLRTGIVRRWLVCNKEIYIQMRRIKINEGKFCSRKCDAIDKKGKKFSTEHKKNLSIARKKLFILNPNRQMREKSSNWKGGRIKDREYIYIKDRNHPFCNKQGYIAEHRLIIEKILNRYLHREEIPHHINKIHSDNRPENLMAFSTHSAHMRFEMGKHKVKPKEIIFDGREYLTQKAEEV